MSKKIPTITEYLDLDCCIEGAVIELQEIIDNPEYIKGSGDIFYDDDYGSIQVAFERKEKDAERARRLVHDKKDQLKTEERERKLYERLKAKYDSSGV